MGASKPIERGLRSGERASSCTPIIIRDKKWNANIDPSAKSRGQEASYTQYGSGKAELGNENQLQLTTKVTTVNYYKRKLRTLKGRGC